VEISEAARRIAIGAHRQVMPRAFSVPIESERGSIFLF
jgi:hypothetical protein